MRRLANWIRANKSVINHISLTADSHPVNSVSHPSFWYDSNGNAPEPFTPVTSQDINEGKLTPRFFRDEVVSYIKDLEAQGEFAHFIWPFHCLTGSRGAAIDDSLMDALVEWTKGGSNYNLIVKGTNPLTEHFGIFRANIPLAGYPETHLNKNLIDTLKEYKHIFLAGEAKSHCVANSLKQAMDDAPELAARFIILEDCMSDVNGMGHLGEPVYERARQMGIKFVKSTDVVLS
jgi:nicotinamidase-related amidase